MPKITAQELRNKYLEFFKSKGHTIIPSASLVPDGQSGALFTMAGMYPLTPYFLGNKHPGGSRVADVQKCVRTIDIDEVGDNAHLTFFEMLGNWSFGDYFKQDAIKWSFEFLSSEHYLNLPLNRLAFSVFAGDDDAPKDDESVAVWKSLGVQDSQLAFLPKADNWWIAGQTGPCGPDTEMFYWTDDGSQPLLPFQEHHSDARWVEIWNDVFMQYEKKEDGELVVLTQTNVDTGMGLDRTLAVLNGQKSVYDTELFKDMWDVLALDQEVMTNGEVRRARIVLDHVRASVFIVGDGITPSNKDRGYVLRRLLRRAMVMARLLNLKHHWLEALIGKVVATYSETYPDVVEKSENIFAIIGEEQKKFTVTLERGLKEFEKIIKLNEAITGRDAFDLYQTYGFPWELTKELAEVTGLKIDHAQFENEFKKHQELSRTASAGMFKGGLVDHEPQTIKHHTAHHLLLAALRQVLGDHVLQRGSNVSKERLRLDFSHPEKVTPEQLKRVEDIVNQKISEDLEVNHEEMPKAEAEKLGALAEFGTKYGDIVSVYTILNNDGTVFSREFCGGPHVDRTGVIGKFKILKEEASSAGVRRIKASAI